MIRTCVVVLTVVLLLVPGATRAQELREQGLRQAAETIARAVRPLADSRGQRVQVGYFNPVGTKDDAGAAISAELAAALGKIVDENGALLVQGTYAFVENANKVRVVNIKAQVLQVSTNEPVTNLVFSAEVKKLSDLARLAGVTREDTSPGGYDERNRRLFETSTGARQGTTLAKPAENSPFAVEIRARPQDQLDAPTAAKEVAVTDGKPSVSIQKGEIYEVRVLNHGSHEAAFTLSIDGLDQFTFTENRTSDGRPAFAHYILPAAREGKPGEVIIKGWHKKFDTTTKQHHHLKFLVTEHGQGAISRFPTKPRGRVGMIELSFAHSHPPGTKLQGRGGETGFGAEGKEGGDVVERVIEPPHAFLTIRYQR